MSADIRQHSQRASRHDRATDREAIEPVSQVHRIARGDEHQHDKHHKRKKRQETEVRNAAQKLPDEVRTEALHKRHHQVGRIRTLTLQNNQRRCHGHSSENLKEHLGPRPEA